MDYYCGIDVSLEHSSVCVVDSKGQIVREAKVLSEPEALIAWFQSLDISLTRVGLEAGPLSQWLYAGLAKAGFAVELLETRHVRERACHFMGSRFLAGIDGSHFASELPCSAMSEPRRSGRYRSCILPFIFGKLTIKEA